MAAGKDKTLAEGLTQIASVLKSNGIEGELVLGFRNFDSDDINLTEPVFIVFDGLPVPFFIESLTKRGNSKALVHLTDIRTFDDAEELAGKAVYIKGLPEAEMSIEDFGFKALVGWTLLAPYMSDDEESDIDDESEDYKESEGYEESEDYESSEDNDWSEDYEESEDNDWSEDYEESENNEGSEDYDETGEEMELEEIGKIIEFYDIPGNPCIEVETKNGTVMIPLHEDLILSVDPEYKELIMTIPEGLLD